MRDATPPFAFSQFVPGFDFLKSLAGAATGTPGSGSGSGSVPGLPSLSNWVAPTLSVEEVDKRIQELKTVQYWLEQNGHALKATIQALEVQKMTLSTLRGMNVRMEDLANAFTRHIPAANAPATPAAPAAAPAPSAPAAAPVSGFFGRMASTAQPDDKNEKIEKSATPVSSTSNEADAKTGGADRAGGQEDSDADSDAGKTGMGVIDPVKWWSAITQQFQQIAETAMKDAAQIQMPQMPQMPGVASPPRGAKTTKSAAGGASSSSSSSPSSRGGSSSKKTASATGRSSGAQASDNAGTGAAKKGSGGGKSAPRKTAAAPRRPRS